MRYRRHVKTAAELCVGDMLEVEVAGVVIQEEVIRVRRQIWTGTFEGQTYRESPMIVYTTGSGQRVYSICSCPSDTKVTLWRAKSTPRPKT